MELGKSYNKDIAIMYQPTKPMEPILTKMIFVRSEENYGNFIKISTLPQPKEVTHFLIKTDSYGDFTLQYYREEPVADKVKAKLQKQYEKDIALYEEKLKLYNEYLETTKKEQIKIQKDNEYKTYLKLKAKYGKSNTDN
jgi:hypothetical protein